MVETVQKLKSVPGKKIITDGSHELVHTLLKHDLVDELHLLLYPNMLGGGKRLLPEGAHATFKLKSATPYPSGVVSLHYENATEHRFEPRAASENPLRGRSFAEPAGMAPNPP